MNRLEEFRLALVVDHAHDGDTVYGDIDHGLGIWQHNWGVRLAGCNARELSVPGGREARDHLAALLPVGARLPLVSVGWDKYARRVDGDLLLPDGSSLVQLLIAQQWVAPWSGSGPAPVPVWPRTVTP